MQNQNELPGENQERRSLAHFSVNDARAIYSLVNLGLRDYAADLFNLKSLEWRQEFLAVMWFGRGDFERFESALDHAGPTPDAHMVPYAFSKTPLCEYLVDGLKRLGVL